VKLADGWDWSRDGKVEKSAGDTSCGCDAGRPRWRKAPVTRNQVCQVTWAGHGTARCGVMGGLSLTQLPTIGLSPHFSSVNVTQTLYVALCDKLIPSTARCSTTLKRAQRWVSELKQLKVKVRRCQQIDVQSMLNLQEGGSNDWCASYQGRLLFFLTLIRHHSLEIIAQS